MDILVINGPNLNMLGSREEDKYGSKTLHELQNELAEYAENHGIYLEFFQSNSEGELVTAIHKSTKYDSIIINAGAYTHTSIAIRDALLSVKAKFIEVHISNIFARESFRHHSYLSDIAIGMITGFKERSYYMAVDYFISQMEEDAK